MYTQDNNMASYDPAGYDPSRAVTVNRNGTIVPGAGDPYDGMVRAGAGVPQEELFRVPTGNTPLALSVPAGAPRGFYGDHHLFAPRFSFAWTPTGNAETAVRGGIGLFYDRPEGNLLFGGADNGPLNNPPHNLSAPYQNRNPSAPGGGTGPPPPARGTLAALDP